LINLKAAHDKEYCVSPGHKVWESSGYPPAQDTGFGVDKRCLFLKYQSRWKKGLPRRNTASLWSCRFSVKNTERETT